MHDFGSQVISWPGSIWAPVMSYSGASPPIAITSATFSCPRIAGVLILTLPCKIWTSVPQIPARRMRPRTAPALSGGMDTSSITNGRVAGGWIACSIATFEVFGNISISYWLSVPECRSLQYRGRSSGANNYPEVRVVDEHTVKVHASRPLNHRFPPACPALRVQAGLNNSDPM